jgi:hypothetical protein
MRGIGVPKKLYVLRDCDREVVEIRVPRRARAVTKTGPCDALVRPLVCSSDRYKGFGPKLLVVVAFAVVGAQTLIM